MEELLLGLLWALVEFIVEAVFEFLVTALADMLLRALGEVFAESRIQNPWLARLGYGLLGLLFGVISLGFFPGRLLQPARVPGISLVISPLLVGLMMWAIGGVLRSRDKEPTQLENFGYGFVFAFGMALLRFLFVK